MSTSYTVTDAHDCKIVTGTVSLADAGMLLQGWASRQEAKPGSDEEWVVDGNLSAHLGAKLVCGPRWATTKYRQYLNIETPAAPPAD
jgi:hypothetical protein